MKPISRAIAPLHVSHRVTQPLGLRIGLFLSVVTALSLFVLDLRGGAAPSPFAPDALLDQQWHLKDRGKETGGANVLAAWPSSAGAGIVIGIVDDGVQYTHPDLSPNYLASASYDFNFNDADPQPYSTAGHGTSVAGVAAARGDNSIGVSGVAPQASIAGLRLTALVASDAQEAAAFNFQPSVIHILNNSWNPTDNGTTLKGPGSQASAARQSAITNGRSGKGRIFVWSSGNGRLTGDDCNFDGYANHRFAIAVGASTDSAVQMPQSEGCSALMVLAPAGGGSRALTTTDLIGSPGYNSGDYTSAFGAASTGGMSAAAPTVSGAVALMLDSNPNLSWRDVQHILRRTSVRIIPTDAGWTTGQYPHNERLGFGLLDVDASVDLAARWASVPGEEVLSANRNVNAPIPDINSNGVTDTITISSNESNFVIEHIEVETTITHPWRGDLQVKLTSPSGVVSMLAPIRPNDSGDNFSAWKFGSVRHWGEAAAGVWRLNVSDRRYQDTGTLNNWTLRIYGYHASGSAPGAFSKSGPGNGATGVSTSPTLSWGGSSGASSYEYCYDTSNDNACNGWTPVGSSTSVGLSGLANGATYFWHVRASNATGVTYSQGSSTAFWSFSTGAPSGAFSLSSPANGATGQSLNPVLSWTPSSGATNYEYCYDTSHNGACNTSWFSTGGPSTSVTLSGLTPSTQYSWHVRALNAAGAATYAGGSSSAFWGLTTIGAPGAFGHSSPANGATNQSGSPTLMWSASTGAASYEYCYDTNNNNACNGTWISTGSATSVGLSGLAASTTYYWQVRALNTGGTTYANGASTAFWSFTTGSLPGAFAKSSPANGATNQSLTPSLDWGASSGATGYEYCYDTTNDNACSNWTSAGAASSGQLSGLSPGTTYYWQARANNGAGATYANGASTSFWSFRTIAVPGAFEHSSPVDGAINASVTPTLSWTASAGAANYAYCYDTTNDNACTNWLGAGNSTSVPLTGLASGTTYYWHVRAANGGGTTYADGAATAFWDFKTRARSTIVDLDGDGTGDAFTYSPSNGAWARQVSNGNGGFTTTTGSWNPGWAVVPANFNSDALTDFFLFNAQSGQWFKMLNNGTGFTTQASGGWWPGWERFVLDLDGDGLSDMFLYDRSSGQWFKAISTANGFNYLQGGWAPNWEIYPVTLNADARADLFLIDRQTGRWFCVLGEAGGSFSYPASETWFSGWQLYPGDFNGDGLSDMLLHDSSTGTFFVATNTGAGFTYRQGGWSLGWTPHAADFDADGTDDLFLHDPSTGAWYEMIGNGAGGFTNAGGQTWSLGWQLRFNDLNGDGRADLVLYDPKSGAWYQARNFTLGSFSYTNGTWASGLIVLTQSPIR